MEAVPPILFLVYYIIGNRQSNLVALVFLLIWEIHYTHRAFIYPLKIRGKKQIPVVIVLMGMVFNGFNAYIQGRFLFLLSPIHTTDWFVTPMFISGTLIFLIGFVVNLNSDHILRNLRKYEFSGQLALCKETPDIWRMLATEGLLSDPGKPGVWENVKCNCKS